MTQSGYKCYVFAILLCIDGCAPSSPIQIDKIPATPVISEEVLAPLYTWLNHQPWQPSPYTKAKEQSELVLHIKQTCQMETLPDWMNTQLAWLSPMANTDHKVYVHEPNQSIKVLSWPLPLMSPMIQLSASDLNAPCALIATILALEHSRGALYLDLSNNQINDSLVPLLIKHLRADEASTKRSIQINLRNNPLSDRAIAKLIHYQKESPNRLFDTRVLSQAEMIASTIDAIKHTQQIKYDESSVYLDMNKLSNNRILANLVQRVLMNPSIETLNISYDKPISESLDLILRQTLKLMPPLASLSLKLTKITDSQMSGLLRTLFSGAHEHTIIDLSTIHMKKEALKVLSSYPIKQKQLFLILGPTNKQIIESIADQHPSWITLYDPIPQ